MIDERRVKLMTKMSIYEKTEGKRELPLAAYYKSDYVNFNTIKTLLYVFVGFVLMIGIYLACHIEQVFRWLNDLDIKQFGIRVGVATLLVLVFYYILCRVVYTIRYNRATKGIKEYNRNLKRLSFLYRKAKEQEQRPTMTEEGSVNTNNDEFIDF